MRVCSTPGCPTIYDQADGPKCPAHRATAEKARGTRKQRGYDKHHDRLRKQWAPQVATGTIRCARCHQPIGAGETWALDHTDDRTAYLGPSHTRCNNSAGGKASHQ